MKNSIKKTIPQNRLKQMALRYMKNWNPDDVEPKSNLSDKERLTIVGIPDSESKKPMTNLIKTLSKIEPNQYYYAPQNLHLTFVGRMPPTLRLFRFENEFRHILAKREYVLSLQGLAANKSGLAILAYPKSFDIHGIRKKLRNLLSDYGTSYSRLFENLCWITIMRFAKRPSKRFHKYVLENLETQFGNINLKKIDILRLKNMMIRNKENKKLFEITL